MNEDLKMNSVALNYDFSQFIEVVEFVNDTQSLLINVLKINPKLKGIFFGKAEYIETIQNSVNEDIKKRCEFIKGNIFTSTPPSGSQLYLLKNIIDPIDENKTINFLNRCSQSTETYTRFLLIEKGKYDISSGNNLDEATKYHKVQEHYKALFKEKNFILTNVINSGNDTEIIEVLRM